jgi:hypothetical protein
MKMNKTPDHPAMALDWEDTLKIGWLHHVAVSLFFILAVPSALAMQEVGGLAINYSLPFTADMASANSWLSEMSANIRPLIASSVPRPGPKPYSSSQSPHRQQAAPAYIRPSTAPNGQPWPRTAAYVVGYQRLHTNGLSTITVDNSRNDSDVFVKLVSLDGPQTYPVRQFFIPAFGNFTLNKVTAGNYDIRYRDLSNGGLSRSEAFSLEEIPTYNGTQFSNTTMTLYKVQNGNMQTYGLSEAEF